MSQAATANCPVVTAFDWVPPFARGLVRDLRVRWAFEEIGRPYRTELYGAANPRGDAYLAWQPFDQVPAFADGDLRFFESGAILLYLGEQDERLLPREPQAKWTALSWLFAALNSVDPSAQRLFAYDVFLKDKPWSGEARDAAAATVAQRLKRVAEALGDKDWLAGTFSIADIAMIHVLQSLRNTQLVADQPRLAAYVARGEARPAYQRALKSQTDDFRDQP